MNVEHMKKGYDKFWDSLPLAQRRVLLKMAGWGGGRKLPLTFDDLDLYTIEEMLRTSNLLEIDGDEIGVKSPEFEAYVLARHQRLTTIAQKMTSHGRADAELVDALARAMAEEL